MKDYNSILKNSNCEIQEKKSRFIANIFYVERLEEIEEKIKSIKKQYFDAKHHCYAYRVIEDETVLERQSDDGEPSGTAGAPILNVLQKNELLNVLVIVTRYFGGTLLGTGGLVRAYSQVTANSIKNAQVVRKQYGNEINIILEYKDLDKFNYYCDKHNIYISDIKYEENIICKIEITKEEKEKLIEQNKKNAMFLSYSVLDEKYITTKREKNKTN